jgi:hypothetical protein
MAIFAGGHTQRKVFEDEKAMGFDSWGSIGFWAFAFGLRYEQR